MASRDRTPAGRLASLTVQPKDCYDPTDYILVHKDRIAQLQRQHAQGLAAWSANNAHHMAQIERLQGALRYVSDQVRSVNPDWGAVCRRLDEELAPLGALP